MVRTLIDQTQVQSFEHFDIFSTCMVNTNINHGKIIVEGQVVRRPVSANPGLNFNPGLFFFSSKAFSQKIFSILLRVTNHQIVDKKNSTEFVF